MATRAPIVHGTPASTWTMVPSWMLESSPTVMASVSPRRTAVGQTLTRAPSVTSPMMIAARWTNALGEIVGAFMAFVKRAEVHFTTEDTEDTENCQGLYGLLRALCDLGGKIAVALRMRDHTPDTARWGSSLDPSPPSAPQRQRECPAANPNRAPRPTAPTRRRSTQSFGR